jgi:hypothetical protein
VEGESLEDAPLVEVPAKASLLGEVMEKRPGFQENITASFNLK